MFRPSVTRIGAAMILAFLSGCSSTPETAPGDTQGSMYWEPGEWGFDAQLVPWPLQAGAPATLRAVAGTDDYDQQFSGTVSYRLVPAGSSLGSWIPMRRVSSDEAGVAYQATVTFTSGQTEVQFYVSRTNDGTKHELTDWTVTAR